MAGKSAFRPLDDDEKAEAGRNVRLAFMLAKKLRKFAWWMDSDDLLSACFEALLRGVRSHRHKGGGFKLGTFVERWTMTLIKHDRLAAMAACRDVRRTVRNFEIALMPCPGSGPCDGEMPSLQAVPLSCRDAVVLCEVHGLDYAEAADRLDISAEAVRHRVRRGLTVAKEAILCRSV